ncbi:hypothetical protein R1sor_021863 [Riccia sorocarpa]|uniref:Zinc finger Mcm10/DnaG-type domain-containing protein n=1 Tax=Riccia sorocarpa TaxID=122646 RepID=A0ABD3GL77_9MARC
MAGEGDDLDLLLSMQDDEENIDDDTEIPPASPPACIKSSPVKAVQNVGFYGRKTEATAEADDENLAFSRRMAQIRASSALKTKEAISRNVTASTFSRNSAIPKSSAVDNLGYCSDEETPKTKKPISMDAFKEIVNDRLESESKKELPLNVKQASQQGSSITNSDVEYFSGLKIKDRLLPPAEVYQKLEDLRFVRLPAIKLANECGKFAGSWATIAILVDKGQPRQSAAGKNFVIWKLGTLDSSAISLFLFGDAYKVHWKQQPGSILACLNANVRLDSKTKEPSLSVFNCDQILALGTSANFAVCNGMRKDGTRCTVAIDKRVHGQYCQYHIGAQQQKYKTKRPELNGGKISIVGPGYERGQMKRKVLHSPEKENNLRRPLKIVTTSQLKCMLSDEKLANKSYFQGKRFLETMADKTIGKKKSTSTGQPKLTPSSVTEKRTPLVDMSKKTINVLNTGSSGRGKLNGLSILTSKKENDTLSVRAKNKVLDAQDTKSKATAGTISKGDDSDIEIDWNEGPEDDVAQALSRFGPIHGMVTLQTESLL